VEGSLPVSAQTGSSMYRLEYVQGQVCTGSSMYRVKYVQGSMLRIYIPMLAEKIKTICDRD
jgi:hypothetical protein